MTPYFIKKFGATWCSHCTPMTRVLEEIKRKYPDKVYISEIDVDDNPELAEKEKIKSLPTIKIYKGDELLHLNIGGMNFSEIEQYIK